MINRHKIATVLGIVGLVFGLYSYFLVEKSNDVLMMLASEKLRVALATTHIPLKKVAKTINEKLINV